jgi:hypothetical protein
MCAVTFHTPNYYWLLGDFILVVELGGKAIKNFNTFVQRFTETSGCFRYIYGATAFCAKRLPVFVARA